MNKNFTIFIIILAFLSLGVRDTFAQNKAPLVLNDTASLPEDTASVLIDVLNNDSDPDGDALSLSIIKTNYGQAVLFSGKIQYFPPPDFSGVDTVTYRLCD